MGQASFEILFPRSLKPGGVYIIEDVHWWGSFAKVQRYIDSLYPYLWLCEKVVGPVGTTGNHCPMVLGAANQALFLARDWRYSIESITYHREALVIRKKAGAPRLDEAQILIEGARPPRGALARGAGRRRGKARGRWRQAKGPG